jgi:hypothetical protein
MVTKVNAELLKWANAPHSSDDTRKLISEVRRLTKFPNNEQVQPPQTISQALFANKVPQRLFDILSQYDDDQILSVGDGGDKLLQFKKNYYQFQTAVKQMDDDMILVVGKLVNNTWKYRNQWELYLRYAILRFDGKSQEEIIANGNQLNFDITWNDAEKVFTQLASEPQVVNDMKTIGNSQMRMIDEANKAALSVQQAEKG